MHELIVKTAFFLTVWRCYFARGIEVRNIAMSMSVCMSVRSHILCRNITKFSVLVTCGESWTFRPADISASGHFGSGLYGLARFGQREFRPICRLDTRYQYTAGLECIPGETACLSQFETQWSGDWQSFKARINACATV